MTVQELIDKLSKENPNAIVYITDITDDIAVIVTQIHRNILEGSEETITIC